VLANAPAPGCIPGALAAIKTRAAPSVTKELRRTRRLTAPGRRTPLTIVPKCPSPSHSSPPQNQAGCQTPEVRAWPASAVPISGVSESHDYTKSIARVAEAAAIFQEGADAQAERASLDDRTSEAINSPKRDRAIEKQRDRHIGSAGDRLGLRQLGSGYATPRLFLLHIPILRRCDLDAVLWRSFFLGRTPSFVIAGNPCTKAFDAASLTRETINSSQSTRPGTCPPSHHLQTNSAGAFSSIDRAVNAHGAIRP